MAPKSKDSWFWDKPNVILTFEGLDRGALSFKLRNKARSFAKTFCSVTKCFKIKKRRTVPPLSRMFGPGKDSLVVGSRNSLYENHKRANTILKLIIDF